MADDFMRYQGMRSLGDRYAKSGEYQKAIDCYRKALETSPHEYGSQVLVDRINSLLPKVQNNQSTSKKSSSSSEKQKTSDAPSLQKEQEPLAQKKPQLNIKTTFMPCRIHVLLSTSKEIPEKACQPLSESIWNSIRQEEAKFDQMIEATVGKNVPAEFQWTPIVCNEKQQFIKLAKDPHDSWVTSLVNSTKAEYYAPFVGAGSFQTDDLGSVHYVMTVLVFGSGKKDSGCFIATACYGNINHPDVCILRNFRDDVLLRHFSGRIITKLYYAISPPIARRLSKNSRLSELVRTKLLMPLVKGIRSTKRSR